MATKPPPAPSVPSSGNQSTSAQSLQNDPYNLNSSGTGILGGTTIPGSNEFFGFPTYTPTGYNSSAGVIGGGGGQGLAYKPLTATESVLAFTHLSGETLAAIQSQMYRAGLYSGNYQPIYGQLHPEDINAFRSVIIGLASNPSQASLSDYLSGAAQAGDKNGVNARTKQPLVVSLRSADDIRAVLQAGANNVFGKFLSEDDVQKFINSYHAQQAGAQTAAYAQGGYNPETGQQDTSGSVATGGTVTQPPTSAEGMNLQLQQQMYADHPVTAEMAQFVNQFDALKSTLSQRLPGGGVG